MSLAIIITGQCRSFFDNDHFLNMILRTQQNYKDIFVVCVLNSPDHIRISNFFKELNIKHLIVDFQRYNNTYLHNAWVKLHNPQYLVLKNKYLASETNAKYEIGGDNIDRILETRVFIQSYQLEVGITHLLDYERANNTQFDIICKTRFDLRYPPDFYPHMPNHTDIFDKINFNKTNRTLFDTKCAELNITNMDELIEFNKKNIVNVADARINYDYGDISFGSMYCYNNYALENIKNGKEDILYAFNDFFFFGKRDTFLKLESWFDESGLIDPSQYNINHFYAPETQLMVYCFKYQINILCYYNDSFEIIR